MGSPQSCQRCHQRHLYLHRPGSSPSSFAELWSPAKQPLRRYTARINACGATPPRTRTCRSLQVVLVRKRVNTSALKSAGRTLVSVNPQSIITGSSVMLSNIKPMRETRALVQCSVRCMTEGRPGLFRNYYRVRCRCRSPNLQQHGMKFPKKMVHEHGILASRKHESENAVNPKQDPSIWRVALEL